MRTIRERRWREARAGRALRPGPERGKRTGMNDIIDAPARPAPRISFVSLGCPKALVDSERILTQLRAEGYELSRQHAGADAVIVNTCGFLDSAKKELLEAIGAAMAENGKVIVTGCMGAEPDQIRDAFPNVSAITGPQAYESVMEAVREAAPAPHDPFVDLIPGDGVRLTPRHYAYLKISEGCNNRCTFCIIPKLRGDLVSRPAAEVLREAEKLVKAGAASRRAGWPKVSTLPPASCAGRFQNYQKRVWSIPPPERTAPLPSTDSQSHFALGYLRSGGKPQDFRDPPLSGG